jgi:serine/threonine protein kinase
MRRDHNIDHFVAGAAADQARIFCARKSSGSEPSVIKQLRSADPELKVRFERDAQAIVQLTHPHICAIYDVLHEHGCNFLVLEYVEGETLAQRLERGPIRIDQALSLAVEIADALDQAHRAGIVHRDLKPANVVLTKSGAKLFDFGLAKLRSIGAASSLRPVRRLGPCGYAASR